MDSKNPKVKTDPKFNLSPGTVKGRVGARPGLTVLRYWQGATEILLRVIIIVSTVAIISRLEKDMNTSILFLHRLSALPQLYPHPLHFSIYTQKHPQMSY